MCHCVMKEQRAFHFKTMALPPQNDGTFFRNDGTFTSKRWHFHPETMALFLVQSRTVHLFCKDNKFKGVLQESGC